MTSETWSLRWLQGCRKGYQKLGDLNSKRVCLVVLEESDKPEPWVLARCSLLGAVRGALASPLLVGWPPFSPGFSPSPPSHSSFPLCMSGSKVPYFFFFFGNRKTFITGPYKEVGGSCLTNPKITESFPPSPFRAKVRMRRGCAESHSRV